MKFNLLLIAAVATVGLASPAPPQDGPSPALVLPRAQGPRKQSKHNHKVTDFRKQCDCPPAICPEALIKDKKSLCACKQSHAQMCHLKSNGGCPRPSLRSC
ncbi:hypothetical protein GE09DRAFT_1129286 [Coniochaeta sp. 2T2.1]|nr:hypothetical protein GE09DRAFT_1129286 [Coniochaeta sp. 2T2.1]